MPVKSFEEIPKDNRNIIDKLSKLHASMYLYIKKHNLIYIKTFNDFDNMLENNRESTTFMQAIKSLLDIADKFKLRCSNDNEFNSMYNEIVELKDTIASSELKDMLLYGNKLNDIELEMYQYRSIKTDSFI